MESFFKKYLVIDFDFGVRDEWNRFSHFTRSGNMLNKRTFVGCEEQRDRRSAYFVLNSSFVRAKLNYRPHSVKFRFFFLFLVKMDSSDLPEPKRFSTHLSCTCRTSFYTISLAGRRR